MNRFLGGVLLIIGTCVGAGMLAMPVATAQNSILISSLMIMICWLVMTLGALFILEVSLSCSADSNLITIAKKHLGPVGSAITWLTYLLLFYSLLSAYIAAGGQITENILGLFNIHDQINSITFTVIMGIIVFAGIYWIDHSNRLLMSLKFFSLFVLIAIIIPSTHWQSTRIFNTQHDMSALTVIITSFGFSPIIPSLRAYFKDDVVALRRVILIGSAIPLALYLVWNTLIHLTLQQQSLMAMAASENASSQLARALIQASQSPLISTFAHLFTSVCVLTSFLGVALSLSDFLADGLKLAKTNLLKRILNISLTLLPPLLIVILYPRIFITALRYAGICCIILLMLLPAIMTWQKRKIKTPTYQVTISRPFLAIYIVASIGIIILSIHFM